MFGFIVFMIIVFGIFRKINRANTRNGNRSFIEDRRKSRRTGSRMSSSSADSMNQQQHQQFMDDMNAQQQRDFMEESMKTVTPWEHGGYDMHNGNSFNDHNTGMF